MIRRQLLLVISCALISLPSCTVWREKPVVNHWTEVTGGESLERSSWKDISSQNWKELEKHMAGNYLAITPEGKLDRAAALTRLQQLKIADCALSDFQVELNASTLVVTYTVLLHGTLNGQPLPSTPTRIMGVWQHQKAGWMAIAHSVDTANRQP